MSRDVFCHRDEMKLFSNLYDKKESSDLIILIKNSYIYIN